MKLEKFQAPIAFIFNRIILIFRTLQLSGLKKTPIPCFWRNAVFLHFSLEKKLASNDAVLRPNSTVTQRYGPILCAKTTQPMDKPGLQPQRPRRPRRKVQAFTSLCSLCSRWRNKFHPVFPICATQDQHSPNLAETAKFLQLPGSGFFKQQKPHKHWSKHLSSTLMSSMFS